MPRLELAEVLVRVASAALTSAAVWAFLAWRDAPGRVLVALVVFGIMMLSWWIEGWILARRSDSST